MKKPIDIWNEPTLVTKKDGTLVSTSLAEIYKEVETPQTPECMHTWEPSWHGFGPTMTCVKCGHIVRD